MKTAARFSAMLLSIALVATAPGLAPYEALAQVRALSGAPVQAPVGLTVPTELPGGSLGVESLGTLENEPLGTLESQPLGSYESVGVGSMPTSESSERSEARGPLFAAPVQKLTQPKAALRLGSQARAASWTPAKAADASQGWTEGTQKFDGSKGLKAAPIDDLSSEGDAPLTRAFSSAPSRSSSVEGAPVRMLGAAPAPTDKGAVAHAIVRTVLSTGRMALGAAAVVGLHVGASLALPSLFGFNPAASLWAVSSGVVLVPMALFARWRLSKVSEYPQGRGPRWLMDGAIGGIIGAAAAALPQYVPVLNGLLPAAHHGALSLGPVLGLGLMAATWTISFYLPYITASIRGRDMVAVRAKAKSESDDQAPKKIPNWHYKVKTGLAIGALAGFFIFLGAAVGGLKGAGISLGISTALQFVMYFLSDKLIQVAVGGKQAPEAQYPALYRIVRELSTKAGAPMPKVFVMPRGMGPNAMATGRDPKHAVVAVTPEAMELFTERELRAVLGHEMSHVMNRDMLTSAILGSFATAIAFMTYSLLWTVSTAKMKFRSWLAKRVPRDSAVQETQNGSKGQQPEMFDPLTGGVVLTSIVGIYRALAGVWAPVIATMLQLAGGRTREFAADYDGALLTGDPAGLASAFEKLQSWKPGPGFRFDMNRAPLMLATAHLFTVSPIEELGLTKQLSLRLPAVSFNSFALVGLGVVFALLSGYSATTRMVNIGFFAWQFFGSKKYFNYAWLGALGYSAFTGWTSPLTLLVWAFFAERAAVWTVALIKKMLPRDGTPREDMDEFVFRKFVTHPATGERIERMKKLEKAMGAGRGPTPPGGSSLGAKDGGGPQGPSLHSAPEASSRSGLDGRLLPAVQQLKGRLERSAELAPLGRALNELLASGGSVGYSDLRLNGQPVLSAFEPATRSIQLSETLRHADPKLQAALLAASLQEARDHLDGRAPGTYEQAVRRMRVVDAFMESEDPSALAAALDINNPAETGLFESLMTSRLLSWQGRTAVEKRFGHLPTAARVVEDAANGLRLAEAELAQRRDHLSLMEQGFAMDLPEDHEQKHRAALEEIAILEASVALQRGRLDDMRVELYENGVARSNSKDAVIDLEALPVFREPRTPFVDSGLEAPLRLMSRTVSSKPELRSKLGFVSESLDLLEARHGRILFGPTPEGQAAYFSPVTRELVISDAYRRIPPALLGALLVHELTHVQDCFEGRSLTRETEHRAFTAMAVFLGAFPPGKVAKQLETSNPAAAHAFQWLYSIRRQYLGGKTTLEAMVANSYTQMFHAKFSGQQSAVGTLSEFRTRTLAPAVEKLEGLRDHERLLVTAIETAPSDERRRQLQATRRQLSVVEGLVAMYRRMERQYAQEAGASE